MHDFAQPIRSSTEQAGAVLPGDPLLQSSILAQMTDGLIAVDPDGRVLTCNPAAAAMLTVDGISAVGRPYAEAFFERPELDGMNDLMLTAIAEPDQVHEAQLALTVSDGTPRHLHVRSSRLRPPPGGGAGGTILVISDVTDRVRALEARVETGKFIMVLVANFCMAMLLVEILVKHLNVNPLTNLFGWTYILAMLLPVSVYIVQMGYSLSMFGVTLRNGRRAIVESIALSGILVLLCAAVRIGGGLAAGETLATFDWAGMITEERFGTGGLLYLAHSYLQEFIARGALQGAIARVFGEGRSPWRPILLAAIIFGVFHVQMGLIAVAITFVSGIGFGWLYHRHGTLLGVGLLHYLAGQAAFAFRFL